MRCKLCYFTWSTEVLDNAYLVIVKKGYICQVQNKIIEQKNNTQARDGHQLNTAEILHTY